MSRGPGKWQRAILERLETDDWFYAADLLAEDAPRSDYSAMLRAAKRLDQKGEISRWEKWRIIWMDTPASRFSEKSKTFLPVLAIAKPEIDLTNERESESIFVAEQSKNISVDRGATNNTPVNT